MFGSETALTVSIISALLMLGIGIIIFIIWIWSMISMIQLNEGFRDFLKDYELRNSERVTESKEDSPWRDEAPELTFEDEAPKGLEKAFTIGLMSILAVLIIAAAFLIYFILL